MEPQPTSLRHSPLQPVHERLGATMTEFAGWQMPLRYGSETAEHNAVRTAAGLFDLSHMGEIALTGPDAGAALDYALVGQPSTLRPGRARYSMICAEDGGVLDDLIVYRLTDTEFLVVANAANTAVVTGELTGRASGFQAGVRDRTSDYALIAIQGPNASKILSSVTDADLDGLKYYTSHAAVVSGRPVLLARTGYTGEDGFEIFCEPGDAEAIWAGLTEAGSGQGLVPAGLSARDTLRLEAGMPLYGNELGRDTTPFDAGLGRVVKLDKPGDFVGRAALAEYAQQPPRRVLAGLTCRGRRVPRHGYAVLWDGQACGTVTSGAPSPTLGKPIAMAYLDPKIAADARERADAGGDSGGAGDAGGDSGLAIDIRGRGEAVDLVTLPFYSRRH
jgi:aminomethyltransferase